MLTGQENDTGDFSARKATGVVQACGSEPKLGAVGVAFHVHMGRLGAVTRVEEETVRADAKDRGHATILPPESTIYNAKPHACAIAEMKLLHQVGYAGVSTMMIYTLTSSSSLRRVRQ